MEKDYSVSVFDTRNTCRTIHIGNYPVSIARDMARVTAEAEGVRKYIVQTKEMDGWFEVYEKPDQLMQVENDMWEKTEWSAQ